MKKLPAFMNLIIRLELKEQQSTWNPNMPLRGLIYFGRLYEAYAKTRNLDIYGRSRIPLPTPKYVVLYNGREPRKEEEIRLSDLYEGAGDVEVTAKIIDINYEDGKAILDHCKILGEYSKFVATMRANMDAGMSAEEAASATVDTCIEEGILRDILIKHKAEVTGMLFTEFDQEIYDNHRRKEGYQDGHKDGEKKGREEGRLYVLYELTASGDLSLEKAAAQAKMPPEQFERMMEEAGFSRR